MVRSDCSIYNLSEITYSTEITYTEMAQICSFACLYLSNKTNKSNQKLFFAFELVFWIRLRFGNDCRVSTAWDLFLFSVCQPVGCSCHVICWLSYFRMHVRPWSVRFHDGTDDLHFRYTLHCDMILIEEDQTSILQQIDWRLGSLGNDDRLDQYTSVHSYNLHHR